MSSDFKNLVAWQKAMELVDEVYEVTKTFPREEMFGLDLSTPACRGLGSQQHR